MGADVDARRTDHRGEDQEGTAETVADAWARGDGQRGRHRGVARNEPPARGLGTTYVHVGQEPRRATADPHLLDDLGCRPRRTTRDQEASGQVTPSDDEGDAGRDRRGRERAELHRGPNRRIHGVGKLVDPSKRLHLEWLDPIAMDGNCADHEAGGTQEPAT